MSSPAAREGLGVDALVSFDCWNTLLSDVDPTRARARQVDAVVAAAGPGLDRDTAGEALDLALAGHTRAWQAGRHHGLGRIVDDLRGRLGLDPASREPLAAALAHVEPDDVRLAPGARQTLTALRRAGYRLGLVCDTGVRPGTTVRRLLAGHGVLDLLDALAFSDEVGVPKPDRRMFDAVLAPLGAAPERSAHVGDLVATDVAGARAAGMRAVLFTGLTPAPDPTGAPDLVVDDLTDLPDALESL